MEVNNVKDVLALLLIKKNNFNISEHENNLIIELEYLLSLAKKKHSNTFEKECQCTINESTITKEIELNQCFVCKLPLVNP
jgi:hypothetical protein